MSSRDAQQVADYLSALYWTLPYDQWEAEGCKVLREWVERSVREEVARDLFDNPPPDEAGR